MCVWFLEQGDIFQTQENLVGLRKRRPLTGPMFGKVVQHQLEAEEKQTRNRWSWGSELGHNSVGTQLNLENISRLWLGMGGNSSTLPLEVIFSGNGFTSVTPLPCSSEPNDLN